MEPLPLVSIVTPCLNAKRFIATTIESVLSQDYPNVEYIVMDGGSTDGTLEILESYHGRLQYFSAKDQGAADAVNRGLARCKGSIFAWINADDEYLPGAISAVVRYFNSNPNADVVYGEAIWTDEKGGEIRRYPTESPYRPGMFAEECGICQPAVFMRREAVAAVGGLSVRRKNGFDYDLWVRMARKYQFFAIPELLATSRMYAANLTLANRRRGYRENMNVILEEYGYIPVNWVYGYLSYLRDRRDQFFEPLRHSPAVYLASLPVGTYYNYRHPWRYWKEWGSRLRMQNLVRVWKEGR